ncbi:putative tricarboxylic transport membrane protein [Sinosporangium album]|uniref:Putative tricarboxylic transport membrane protein n=1 Tax=Sinosporangium album TaxID=504805 RepID=A0A1G8IAU8_9ACTN|nr:tripartite tricarboxylate transporter substrate-binding protein [Sinosporangium album]SDI15690.1 putative tricarboxylic transport membrane protein [Sinosporangium album]
MRRRRFLTLSGLALCTAGCGAADGAAGRESTRISITAANSGHALAIAHAIADALRGERLATATLTGVGGVTSAFAGGSDGGSRLLVMGLADLAAAEIDGDGRAAAAVTPLARLIGDCEALVVPARSKFASFEDFAAALKADPAGVPVAGGPTGGADHVLFGMIGQCLGTDVRLLDYAGFHGHADPALLGTRVVAAIGPLKAWRAGIARGTLRPLAVSTVSRVKGIDAPTLLECGVRVDYSDWHAIVGAPRLGDDATANAVDLLDRLAASPSWGRACGAHGWRRIDLSGDDCRQWLTSETARIHESLRDLGLLSRPDHRCPGGSCARRH